MSKNKFNENEKFEFLDEKIKKINIQETIYPKIEIEKILNSKNNLILLNGKYGSGKSTIVNSIPRDKVKVVNLSILEDDVKYFKFNIYKEIQKSDNWFKKIYSFIKSQLLFFISILTIIFF